MGGRHYTFERDVKEGTLFCFKVPSRHLYGKTEEHHEKYQSKEPVSRLRIELESSQYVSMAMPYYTCVLT
jgi:hypothetical protein